MVSGIQETMILDCLDIQIPIGLVVSLTGRAPQAFFSVLGREWYRGIVRSSLVLLLVLQKLNILQLAQPIVKLYVFRSYCQVYLDLS